MICSPILPMVGHAAFLLIVLGLLAAQRMWELSRSTRNEALLRKHGAREHAPGQVPFMIGLHVLWFVSMVVEGLAAPQPLPWVPCIAALVAFVLGQILRLGAMRALGRFWTVKVITLPGAHVIAKGPFRFIRHPNYLGVWLETVALPLVVGAPWTALVFALAQSVFLLFRIRAEEAALSRTTDYARKLGQHGRFVPRRSHGIL